MTERALPGGRRGGREVAARAADLDAAVHLLRRLLRGARPGRATCAPHRPEAGDRGDPRRGARRTGRRRCATCARCCSAALDAAAMGFLDGPRTVRVRPPGLRARRRRELDGRVPARRRSRLPLPRDGRAGHGRRRRARLPRRDPRPGHRPARADRAAAVGRRAHGPHRAGASRSRCSPTCSAAWPRHPYQPRHEVEPLAATGDRRAAPHAHRRPGLRRRVRRPAASARCGAHSGAALCTAFGPAAVVVAARRPAGRCRAARRASRCRRSVGGARSSTRGSWPRRTGSACLSSRTPSTTPPRCARCSTSAWTD